jgi:hypothetical protein
MNTFYYSLFMPSGSIPNGLLELGDMFNILAAPGQLYDRWIDTRSADLVDAKVDLQVIKFTRFRKATFTPVKAVGQIAGPALPSNTAAVITLASDLAARSGVANKHLPAIPTAAVVNSVLTAGYVGDLGNLADQALQPLNTGAGKTWNPCIYNRATPAASKPLADFLVNPYARVMRRRTVGLGI